MRLKALASWPISPLPVTGTRVLRSPRATRSALSVTACSPWVMRRDSGRMPIRAMPIRARP